MAADPPDSEDLLELWRVILTIRTDLTRLATQMKQFTEMYRDHIIKAHEGGNI